MQTSAHPSDGAAPPLQNPNLKSCVNHWPDDARRCFQTIRGIVYEVSARADVGPLIETLKWGQPSWLPERKRTGTTLRCFWSPQRPERISLFVPCSTTLIETMKTLYPKTFEYEGKRGLHMSLTEDLPHDAIDHCAFLTLTYHRKSA